MNKGVIAIIAAVILVGGGVGAFALAGAPAAPKEPTPRLAAQTQK
jgi:hypothetical protein